jgi:hypothetical protein
MRPKSFANGIVLSILTVMLLAATADVPAAVLSSSVTVPVAGIVNGRPESVSLSGSVTIVSRLSSDPLLGEAMRNRVTIKLVNVSGVGMTSGTSYVATGENTEMRLAAAADQFDVMFPFYRNTPAGPMAARSGTLSITLKVNLANGKIGGATASIATPRLGG